MGAAESPGLPEHGGVQPQRFGGQGASAGRAAGGAAPRGQGLANARRGRHLLSNLCFQTNSCWRRLRKGWRLIWLAFPGSEATKRSNETTKQRHKARPPTGLPLAPQRHRAAMHVQPVPRAPQLRQASVHSHVLAGNRLRVRRRRRPSLCPQCRGWCLA